MSRDAYQRDSYQRDTNRESHSQRLPSIYSVLGAPTSDVLGQSSPPSPSEGRRSYPPPSSSERERASAASESYQRSGYPLRSTYPPSRSTYHTSSHQSHPSQAPGHSFHLFNLIPDQGLVHQRSSSRDDLDPSIPKPRLPPSDPARKYVCSECGNRFSKQSTLRNHMLTHTGERPFACTHPGCGRRFSMACNMQRHMRTHTSASAFEIDQVEDDWSTQPSSRGGSSRGGSMSRDGSMSRGGSPREDWSSSRYVGRS
ncbi:hypothetical protein BU17DRAFT_80766 [Hysterangium stoloniferum]|nr:hypothetical protein BU17DRAFT_80766 [Hysterangium stoloniferum]